MNSTDEHCNLDALRSEKRSFSGYLRRLVWRIEHELGVKNVGAQALLNIESPDDFLEELLCPQYFLYVCLCIESRVLCSYVPTSSKNMNLSSSDRTCVISTSRQLIQVIKAEPKLPSCVKNTESGLMTAAICIGAASGMRTPTGPLTVRFRVLERPLHPLRLISV
jgi:hypothetical protein